MLRLCQVRPERLDYYLNITESISNDPFAERDGYWLGSGPTSFGLGGEVRAPDLYLVGSGRHPSTNKLLNRYQASVTFAATDATFAAPKTVSLLHALGSEEVRDQITMAHRNSVEESLAFIERRLVRVRQSSNGVRTQDRGSLFGAAVFEHRLSRSLDPHLHSHLLIMNLARKRSLPIDSSTRWSAFHAAPLFFHCGLLGALYRSNLRQEMTNSLGVRWTARRHGWYDLEGFSPAMVSAFSRRQGEILADLARSGYSTSHAMAISAKQSRSARVHSTSYEELADRWLDRSFLAGISPTRLREVTDSRTQDRPRSSGVKDQQITETIDRVAKTLNPQPALTTLLRSVVDELPSGAGITDLEDHVADAIDRRSLTAPTELWPFGPRADHRTPRQALLQEQARSRRSSSLGIDHGPNQNNARERDEESLSYAR
jgi:conjugative relaxase-like TrwC/TraI family protein